MSAEMYTFHEAIDEMQRAEEEVLDNHKAISDYLQHALQRCNQLLGITRDVDYDQDGELHGNSSQRALQPTLKTYIALLCNSCYVDSAFWLTLMYCLYIYVQRYVV